MKHIIILMLLAFHLTINAQSNNSGLTPVQLQSAKEYFIKMISSETYLQLKNNVRDQADKLNGLDFPFPDKTKLKTDEDVKKWLANPTDMRAWFSENLSKTDFKSVDEGVTSVLSSIELSEKMLNENKDFYNLLKKATKAQLMEIYEPGKENFFEVMDRHSGKKS